MNYVTIPPATRDGGAASVRAGLRVSKGTVGSNPTLSTSLKDKPLIFKGFFFFFFYS